jgi:hypothetical protein
MFTAAAWLQRGDFCNETWVFGHPAIFRHEARRAETLGNVTAMPRHDRSMKSKEESQGYPAWGAGRRLLGGHAAMAFSTALSNGSYSTSS